MDNKRSYFQKLKDHPGLGLVIMFTFMFFYAGATNKSLQPNHGIIFGAMASLIVWIPVLLSNIRRE